MTPEEINKRMEILLGLRGFSLVKMTNKTVLWKLVSDDELLIDVTFPANLWEVKHKGKVYEPQSPELPVSTKNMISALVEDYDAACKQMLEPEKESYPIESFLEPGDDSMPSTIKLSDAEIIRVLNETMLRPGPTDKTYGKVEA